MREYHGELTLPVYIDVLVVFLIDNDIEATAMLCIDSFAGQDT